MSTCNRFSNRLIDTAVLTEGGLHGAWCMQDKLMKKRLQARRFCFVRHPAYKELIEPIPNTSQWLDPKRKEFWRTDVERVLHREADERKARYKVSFNPLQATPLTPITVVYHLELHVAITFNQWYHCSPM